jgi:hypothetical protein
MIQDMIRAVLLWSGVGTDVVGGKKVVEKDVVEDDAVVEDDVVVEVDVVVVDDVVVVLSKQNQIGQLTYDLTSD